MARLIIGPMGYNTAQIDLVRSTTPGTYATNETVRDDGNITWSTSEKLAYSFGNYEQVLNGGFSFTYTGPNTGGGSGYQYSVFSNGEMIADYRNIYVPLRYHSIAGSFPSDYSIRQVALSGADSITASEADDRFEAFGGNDTIFGLGGGDTLYAGDGDDLVYGNMGQDGIMGGAGADTIFGGKEFDSLWGEAGDDVVNGNMGDDVVVGGEGNNTLYGGQDNDLLWGESGSDHLYGDKGNDTLRGGGGADMFYLQVEGGTDYITDFNYAEGDRVIVAAGMPYAVGTDNGLHLTLSDGSTIYLVGHTTPGGIAGNWIITG